MGTKGISEKGEINLNFIFYGYILGVKLLWLLIKECRLMDYEPLRGSKEIS